ncbi:unnamed protein product [Peniophora sp. CBMAI 1063]|nr:unnamed protein product [Peniophora sp. CBMAI 1063]
MDDKEEDIGQREVVLPDGHGREPSLTTQATNEAIALDVLSVLRQIESKIDAEVLARAELASRVDEVAASLLLVKEAVTKQQETSKEMTQAIAISARRLHNIGSSLRANQAVLDHRLCVFNRLLNHTLLSRVDCETELLMKLRGVWQAIISAGSNIQADGTATCVTVQRHLNDFYSRVLDGIPPANYPMMINRVILVLMMALLATAFGFHLIFVYASVGFALGSLPFLHVID